MNKLNFYRYEKCFLCEGLGTIEVKAHLHDDYGHVETCPQCEGRGQLQILMDLNNEDIK